MIKIGRFIRIARPCAADRKIHLHEERLIKRCRIRLVVLTFLSSEPVIDGQIQGYKYLKQSYEEYCQSLRDNARLEAMEKEKMMPVDMQNPTSNMLPLGGLGGLTNMMHFHPSELR